MSSWLTRAVSAPAPARKSLTRTNKGAVQSAGGLRARIPLLAAPLAALIYPFTLTGFNASVLAIDEASAGLLPRLTAAFSLLARLRCPDDLATSSYVIGRNSAANCCGAARVTLLAVTERIHVHGCLTLHDARSRAGHVALGSIVAVDIWLMSRSGSIVHVRNA